VTDRRYFAAVWIAVPLLVLVLVGAFVRVPYVVMGPGLAQNTLGKMQNRQVISVQGAPVHQPQGQLLFTTVEVRDGIDVGSALWYGLNPRYQLVPREAVFPPNLSTKQVNQENAAQFSGSEQDATAAALKFLHIPTATGVVGVTAGGPSQDKLKAGDVLTQVAGAAIGSMDDVLKAVAAQRPGRTVPVRVLRDGTEVTVDITLGRRTASDGAGTSARGADDQDAKPVLGILVGQVPADSKLRIGFGVGDVGGPSAGLMLTLGIIDLLEPDDLTGNRIVAGTGTITPDGKVGEIGGIEHKVVGARDQGATVFLVPSANCAMAKSHAPAGLRLVKVDTLEGAVRALGEVRAGKPTPTC
jgi:PDZ domain-containing protein